VLSLYRRLPQLLLGRRLDLSQAVDCIVNFPLYLVAKLLYAGLI
jgi:hypothetical protein